MVVALVAVSVPMVSGSVESALCQILKIGRKNCESNHDAQRNDDDPYDYSPDYCVKRGEEKKGGHKVDMGLLTIGKEHRYIKETLSNGKVVLTFVPEDTAGLTGAAPGMDFGTKKAASAKAEAEGDITAKISAGRTFILEDKNEYKKFKDEIANAISEEKERDDPNGGRNNIGEDWAEELGWAEPPKVRDPTVRSFTSGLDAQGESGVGAWLGSNRKPGKNEGKYNVNTGREGEVEVDSNVDTSVWSDDPDNTKSSSTYSYSVRDSRTTELLGKQGGGEASHNGATRIMRNEDGSLRNVRYTTKLSRFEKDGGGGKGDKGGDKSGKGKHTEGNGKSVSQAVQIDFDTPREREIGEKMLKERGVRPPENVTESLENELMDKKNGERINEKPSEDAPEWEKLFYKKGKAWQNESALRRQENEVSAELKMGLQFGASMDWGTERSRSTDAQILDAPQDGKREFVDYPDCVSDQGN